jgi:hypothetical protein
VHAPPQLPLYFLPHALFFKRPVAGLWKYELCRQRYQIASVRTVTKTRAERAILIDLTIGLGIPLLQIPFHASLYRSPSNPNPDLPCIEYIVQGRHYNIYLRGHRLPRETYETRVAVILFHLPPILIGAISAVYCGASPFSPSPIIQRALT